MTPDFERIAKDIHSEVNTWSTDDDQLKFILEKLQGVWNARGAADHEKMSNELPCDIDRALEKIKELDV